MNAVITMSRYRFFTTIIPLLVRMYLFSSSTTATSRTALVKPRTSSRACRRFALSTPAWKVVLWMVVIVSSPFLFPFVVFIIPRRRGFVNPLFEKFSVIFSVFSTLESAQTEFAQLIVEGVFVRNFEPFSFLAVNGSNYHFITHFDDFLVEQTFHKMLALFHGLYIANATDFGVVCSVSIEAVCKVACKTSLEQGVVLLFIHHQIHRIHFNLPLSFSCCFPLLLYLL